MPDRLALLFAVIVNDFAAYARVSNVILQQRLSKAAVRTHGAGPVDHCVEGITHIMICMICSNFMSPR
jgi:hypothetical protein